MDLQEFLRKAREKEGKKIRMISLEVDEIGIVDFQRPEDKDILEYTSEITKAAQFKKEKKLNKKTNEVEDIEVVESINLEIMHKAATKLVYLSCSLIRAKETRDEFKSNDPFNIPSLIFGSNEVLRIAGEIMKAFSGNKIAKKITDDIKN
ncbi:MAG: hypothetical protein ACRC0S_01635 [Fusobacteriaceae bacterium]